MAEFSYTIRTDKGSRETGSITAENYNEALNKLQANNSVVISLKERDTSFDFIKPFIDRLSLALEEIKNRVPITVGKVIIKLFELEKILFSSIAYLSFGQKKKLAFARLYLLQTKIWLLDEPFAGMDKNNKNLIVNLIKNHNINKGATIISTHESLNLINIKNNKEINIV